jgi:hypothetical protein
MYTGYAGKLEATSFTTTHDSATSRAAPTTEHLDWGLSSVGVLFHYRN